MVYVIFIYGFILLPFVAFEAVVGWYILSKMGEKGWKVFIPFYNEYLLFKRAWNKNYYWIKLAFRLLYWFLYGYSRYITYSEPGRDTTVPNILLVLTGCVMIVFFIFRQINLSKSFGYPKSFAVGMVFIPVVMTAILAFGKGQYIGIKPFRTGERTADPDRNFNDLN